MAKDIKHEGWTTEEWNKTVDVLNKMLAPYFPNRENEEEENINA